MRLLLILHANSPAEKASFIERHDLVDDLARCGSTYSLRYKMKNGSFAVVEDIHRDSLELDLLRRKYLYKTILFDLSPGSSPPLPESFRNCRKFTPDMIDRNMNVKTWLDRKLFPITDLSKYESVYHIGDIQGCINPLEDFLREHYNEKNFYIFCGDYLDRGPHNDLVFLKIYNELIKQENMVFLWGNHESELIRYANGRPLKIPEFRDKTLPQLRAAGVTQDMAHDFCKRLRDVFVYAYAGKKVVSSHGGLLDLPQRFLTHPSCEFRGEKTKDLKDIFVGPIVMHHSFNAAVDGTEWIQVHGHTNAEGRSISHFKHTILLNDYPELGQNMRVWKLDRDGTQTPIYIKSHGISLSMRTQTNAASRKRPALDVN